MVLCRTPPSDWCGGAVTSIAAHDPLRPPGAVMTERDGVPVVAHYGSVSAEIAVTTKAAGLVDRSGMRQLAIAGEDALVDRVLAAAVPGGGPGAGRAASVAGTWCCRVTGRRAIVAGGPRAIGRWRQVAARAIATAGLDVRLDGLSGAAALSLVGPRAERIALAAGLPAAVGVGGGRRGHGGRLAGDARARAGRPLPAALRAGSPERGLAGALGRRPRAWARAGGQRGARAAPGVAPPARIGGRATAWRSAARTMVGTVIAKVEPLTPARALRGPFDYRLSGELAGVGVGSMLVVPFGRRRLLGVVVDLAGSSDCRRSGWSSRSRRSRPTCPRRSSGWGCGWHRSTCRRPRAASRWCCRPGPAPARRGRCGRARSLRAELTADGRAALAGGVRLGDRQRAVLERAHARGRRASPPWPGSPVPTTRRCAASSGAVS